MKDNLTRIPANQNEITLYCFIGEAVWTIQIVEQALSHSITLKMNPDETKEKAEDFLKQHQKYTLGKAIHIATQKQLYSLSLQHELLNFLEQRNWLIHKAMAESRHGLNWEDKKEELFQKIKAISNRGQSIHRTIEYDMIDFCISKGRDMSKVLELLKLQEQGVRIQK